MQQLSELKSVDLEEKSESQITEKIKKLGLVREAFAAIQIDMNPVSKKVGDVKYDATLCDHNCTTVLNGEPTGGNYTCPAAISLNKGLNPKDLAPTEKIIQGLKSSLNGILASRPEFFSTIFPLYCIENKIPSHISKIYESILQEETIEVNLFGGSPEIHPGILSIIQDIQSGGHKAHLTTTGKRMMTNPKFLESFLENPSDLLAFGADDFESVEFLKGCFSMSLDDLKDNWKKTPWYQGQRKKAYEAIYITRIAKDNKKFPPILYNLVVHPGNLNEIYEIFDYLTEHAPNVVLNPYPVQTAFFGSESEYNESHLQDLEKLIDTIIAEHIHYANGGQLRWNIVTRVHYWLMLKSVYLNFNNTKERANMIGGENLWTCYKAPGAGRCVQVASSQTKYEEGKDIPGGHLGCFWNSKTVNDNRQIWNMNENEIKNWIFDGRVELGNTAKNPCKGCGFPRMSFDSISLEIGLGDTIRDTYFKLRKEKIGF
ncbi:hypothetical protein PGC35_20260 [Psychrobacillus sp. PGGUH221]|uniref:hypothetical protein n=1 Tax=Psychrobacillus sp. PGGUH221 TaxID=3020058 RepID=UPI0035C759C0